MLTQNHRALVKSWSRNSCHQLEKCLIALFFIVLYIFYGLTASRLPADSYHYNIISSQKDIALVLALNSSVIIIGAISQELSLLNDD